MYQKPANIYTLLLLLVTSCHFTSSHKIAIVGGGIGGTSNAFFLRQLLGDQAQIKIFEKEAIGGRLREMKIGGKSYDSGGSIIHSENFYSKALTEKVGLKVEKLDNSGGAGFYDGKGYVLKLTGTAFKDKFKVLGRYGFGVSNVVKEGEKMLKNLKKVYCLQQNQVSFKTPVELLNATAPDFVKKLGQTMKETLTSIGVADIIQNELVAATLHTNYNQDLGVNGFVGFVSLAGGLVGSLWRVDGGNFLLPARLVEHTKAEVISSTVKSISPSSSSGYTLTYSTSDAEDITEDFDAVIIATPLHNAELDLPDDIDQESYLKPFQRTLATFVNGILAPLVPGEKNPSDILTVTSKDKLLFSSIGMKGEADKDFNYKIFSKEQLTEAQLNKLFSKINDVKVVDWLAYPKYSVPDSVPNFEMAPGLYYVNAIESAASAIEMSCIGSKNVALLAYQYLEKVDNVDSGKVCRDVRNFREEL